MKAEDDSGDYASWDVDAKGGIVPILSGGKEEVQCATLACFLEAGTIPQIPSMGVDWAGFLTGSKTFGEIDAEIRQSLIAAGREDFRPEYRIDGDRLTLEVARGN